MKTKRQIIEIDEAKCNGCGLCAAACAEGAIEIVGGKACIVQEAYCDGLGACIGECPEGALTIVERGVDAFDAEAAEARLRAGGKTEPPEEKTPPRGCPSARIQMLTVPPVSSTNPPSSALVHWPVQIRLVPPTAPFLKGASLLVASDCTPVAYPDFHKDFLKGRAVLIGCPKFDDMEANVSKLKDIFLTAEIKDITVLIMEAPCCSKLSMIVKEGLRRAGRKIPVEVAVVSARGQIIDRTALAV
ncbi:MAG: 4Fe-4S binding protein [Syntrophobacterales bacterium]|nr:4Fe-4S binding protein [Syntrophobacterales bacterium]